MQPPVLLPSVCDVDSDGFIDQLPGISTGLRAIESDTVQSYEVGGKLTLLDGKLRVDAAAYQTNWDDISVAYNAIPGCGTTIPAGEAPNTRG